jgi:hypothetical protein
MPRSRPTRTALVLLLLALLAAPAPGTAGGRPAQPGGWKVGLAWEAWQWMSGFFAGGREELGREEGRRARGSNVPRKSGCRVDPSGLCIVEPAAQPPQMLCSGSPGSSCSG